MPNAVIGIVLGAARFPRSPGLDSEILAQAFATSRRDVMRLLWSFAADVLDLFDSRRSPNEVCEELDEFLRRHPGATDVIVYYVGHGGFLDDQSYFLALHETATDREHVTALRAADLATTLKKGFRKGRTFVILDSCFAGSALPSFQGPLQDLINQQALQGVVLLNAASKDKAAIVPSGAARTMFSDCLCDVLSSGLPDAEPRLSVRQVRDAIWQRIAEKYPNESKVWPEVHTPRQYGPHDLADFPLFPNAAWRAPMPAKVTPAAPLAASVAPSRSVAVPPPMPASVPPPRTRERRVGRVQDEPTPPRVAARAQPREAPIAPSEEAPPLASSKRAAAGVVSSASPAVLDRPRLQRRKAFGVGSVLATVSVLLVLYLWLGRDGALRVSIETDTGSPPPSEVGVIVDGRLPCGSVPCDFAGLRAGTHSIAVHSAGYESVESTVEVLAHQTTTHRVRLTPRHTGITVSGGHTGLTLLVDGEEFGSLPQNLADMEPGEHVVQVTGGPRYEVFTQRVAVEAGRMTPIGPIRLKVIRGLVTVSAGAGADGAETTLTVGDSRRVLPPLPVTIEVPTDLPHILTATRKGFVPFEEPITFEDGQAEKTIEITLAELDAQQKPDQDVAKSRPARANQKNAARSSDSPKPTPTQMYENVALALNAAAEKSKHCNVGNGPTGEGKVRVAFNQDGSATNVEIVDATFGGTETGACVIDIFRRVKVPPFRGNSTTFIKRFNIDYRIVLDEEPGSSPSP